MTTSLAWRTSTAPVADGDGGPHQLVIPTLGELARRAIPQALEAAVVPAVILLVVGNLAGTTAAILAALAWALVAIGWRRATGRRVSGLTILAATRLTLRSVVAIAMRSTFVYFVQPAIGGICLAGAFLVSVVVNRPLARRFAGDFCTMPRRLLHDSRVHRFFRRVSLMWGVVGMLNAGLGLWLLTTQSTDVYVVASTVLSLAVTAGAVAASVLWFRRTAARVAGPCA